MYENLIETLRFCAKNGDCHDCPFEKPCAGTMGDGLYCEAADAIEELSKYVNTIRRLKSDGWYLQQAKNHDGYEAIATMPLPEPPKEER